MQWINTTSDPAHLSSINEALHKETVHRDDKQEVEVEENKLPPHRDNKQDIEVEEDKLPSQSCIQQKLSNRRKKTPLTRTEDFLWG